MYPFSILVNKENPLNPHYIPSDLIEPDIMPRATTHVASYSGKLPLPQKNCLNAPKKRKSIYGEFPVIAPIKGRKNCSLLQMDAPVLLRLDAVSIRPVLPLISPARMKTMN